MEAIPKSCLYLGLVLWFIKLCLCIQFRDTKCIYANNGNLEEIELNILNANTEECEN